MARLAIVSPSPTGPWGGNRITSRRWATLLRELGHRVRITARDDGRPADGAFVLNARRGAVAARRIAARGIPLVVGLTGTDLYVDLPDHAGARRSVELADRLIVLQPNALRRLPAAARRKARVILQSVDASALEPAPHRARDDGLVVCVLGHLRPVKDPFRAALAVRRLPGTARVSVVQIGRALSATMERRARAEAARNPRYRWLGERRRPAALRELARADVLVVSSRSEGGANVIGEAAVLGVGVLASRVDGNTGLLGTRHPGLFDFGDTERLAMLLGRCAREPAFLAGLREASTRLAPLFEPAREQAALGALLAEMGLDD